jgi:hypothetical protein
MASPASWCCTHACLILSQRLSARTSHRYVTRGRYDMCSHQVVTCTAALHTVLLLGPSKISACVKSGAHITFSTEANNVMYIVQ